MILLHAQVQGEASETEEGFEGHAVKLIVPWWASEEDCELLQRFTDRATTKED